jgi:hypothetical protein
MPSIEVLLDSGRIVVQSHVCPKCLGPMTLIRITPSQIGFDLHTFEGVNCHHVDKVVTETKSMKWMSSGLRAPV